MNTGGKRKGHMENFSLSLERFMVAGLSHTEGKGRNRIQQAEADGAGGLSVRVSATPESRVCCPQPQCVRKRREMLSLTPAGLGDL